MKKQPITQEQLQKLATYQTQLEWTIEYICPGCWTLGSLRAELKEVKEAIKACGEEIDGEAPDGTFDGLSEEEWRLYENVISYCVAVRQACKRLTEEQLDFVAGDA